MNQLDTTIIIEKEAHDFYDRHIDGSSSPNAIDDVHSIRSRLIDFYTEESKAIFLNKLFNLVSDDLQIHRDEAHGGQKVPNCPREEKPEKILFYIKQELDNLPTIIQKKSVEQTINRRDKVFVSYCHEDANFLSEIKKFFKPFQDRIDFWEDTKIRPGSKWKEEIRNTINRTKIAILLISSDFLASDFISTDELPPLLHAAENDGCTIISLILKPVYFEGFPKLNQYQTMNPPSKPIIKMADWEKDELYVNLVRQTLEILES